MNTPAWRGPAHILASLAALLLRFKQQLLRHQQARHLPPAPPLLSPHWFRVAGLRPQLQLLQPAQQQRQVLRGQVWQTLVSADGRHSFRLNAAAWAAVGRCDGQHTVQQLWAAAQAAQGEAAPTQPQLLHMLSQLHAAGLLSFDRPPSFGDAALAPEPTTLWGAQQAPADPARRQHLLAWRISLGNPDASLARLARAGSRCTGGLGSGPLLVAWLLLMLGSAGAALLQASELAPAAQRVVSTPSNWGLAWLLYPVMKLLHELGHGCVARRLGATVNDWGITFLVFMPVPYVDASAASALPRRRQRLAVSAAGMAVELSLAAAACSVALLVQPGALRDAALLLCALAVGSSLLVNANPLLRFDGYHMLCDALGLPNLASRSQRHWQQRLRQHLLRVPPDAAPALAAAPGESAWLWLYAPAALLMRWVVGLAVVMWLGAWAQGLGQLALALLVWQGLLVPLRGLLHGGARAPEPADQHGPTGPAKALWRVMVPALMPALILTAVLLWPLPVATVAQGVWWLPEQALLRTQEAGWVQAVHAADGQPLRAGDAVLTLHNPALQAEAERLQGRVQDLQADEARTLRADPAAAAAAGHALQAALAELQQNQLRRQQLTLRAQTSGRLALDRAADLPGRHLPRGTLVAHLVTSDPGIVQVAIAQDDAAALPVSAHAVQVLAPGHGAGAGSGPLQGTWRGAATGAQNRLPSPALGSRSGGRIAVDSADPLGLQTLQPVVVGEVQLQGAPARRIGQRVLVRFDHGHAPLLLQGARALQQQLLHHFNPAS